MSIFEKSDKGARLHPQPPTPFRRSRQLTAPPSRVPIGMTWYIVYTTVTCSITQCHLYILTPYIENTLHTLVTCYAINHTCSFLVSICTCDDKTSYIPLQHIDHQEVENVFSTYGIHRKTYSQLQHSHLSKIKQAIIQSLEAHPRLCTTA